MSITLWSACKDGVEKDLSLDSECLDDPVENSSTEKLTSPHKDGIHLFLHRAQKTVENGFLRCRCCCQDSVECLVPQPSKPHYEGLESPEAQSEDTTPGTIITCLSEQRTESLSVQSSSNSSPECSVITGAPDSQSLHNITTPDITSIAEDNVEKKSSTSATDKHTSWKKTRSFFWRIHKAMKLPLLCSGVDVVEPFGPTADSSEAQRGDSTQTLNLDESSNGTLSGSESFPLPGEVLFQPKEASLLEISSASETEITFETGTFMKIGGLS